MDTTKLFWTGFAAFLLITLLDIVLLVVDAVPLWAFLVIMVAAVAAMLVPLAFVKGPEVEFGETSFHVKAMFVDVDVPYGGITSVDYVRGFDPGVRVWGYGGISRVFGDFSSKQLGAYTAAGDVSIDAMIVVRYRVKGKERTLAFNLRDEASTAEAYERISSLSGKEASPLTPSRSAEAERSHRSRTRIIAGVVAVGAIIVVAVVALAMTSGHVDVTMDGSSLAVDASFVDEEVPLESISSVELRYGMDYGSRVAGLGGSSYLSGDFRNDEFGRYVLAVHRDVDACIVVHWTDGVLVFNLGTVEETEAFYEELSAMAGSMVAAAQAPAGAPAV